MIEKFTKDVNQLLGNINIKKLNNKLYTHYYELVKKSLIKISRFTSKRIKYYY